MTSDPMTRDPIMTPDDAMRRIDALLSHVWMVRTFLKHSEEADGDDELNAIYRELYDGMHALGGPWKQQDATAYLRTARKKRSKFERAAADFARLQPDISVHTNFQMAATSLSHAVREIGHVLDAVD